jgi:4-hydroxybenzoate polyprenyltransferase
LSLVAVTVLMTQFSISALNDWADRHRDAAVGRAKPLVIGHLRPGIALSLAIVFALCVLPGSLAFGLAAGLVVLIGFAAGLAYDLWLSATPLSFLPFAIAFPLLPAWVGLIAGRPLRSFAWLLVAGALLAIAIHLGDSLPDIESDSAAGSRNLAVTLGRARTVGAIIALLLAGALLVVASLASELILAVSVGVAALIAASLLAGSRSRAQPARWIIGAFAIVATMALITHLPRG